MDPLCVGAEVHLQAQEDNELLLQRADSLDVPLAGGDVAVHQRQDGGSGAEVSVDGCHLVTVESADPGYQVGPGVASGLDSFDMGEQSAQVDEDFLSLVVGDVADGEQLPEGACVVTGLGGDLVVVDDGGFDVSNAVVDELKDQLHSGHGETGIARASVFDALALPGEGGG
jgi:hypothetical protein